MINYRVYGPYEIPKKKVAKGMALDLTAPSLKGFWVGVDKIVADLKNGRGCYVFATRAGGGFTPWYVGQSKGSFSKEVFSHKNRNHYQQVYGDIAAATPVLFLVTRITPGGKLSKKTLSEGEANYIEHKLIGYALGKNPDLINVSNTKLHKEVVIPGVHNSSGKLDRPSRNLRTTLGIKSPKKPRAAKASSSKTE